MRNRTRLMISKVDDAGEWLDFSGRRKTLLPDCKDFDSMEKTSARRSFSRSTVASTMANRT